MRLVLATLASLALLSCSAERASQPLPTSASPSPSTLAASPIAGSGCGSTAVVQGSIPQWLDDAGGHNNPRGVPYVIAHPPLAAGFLFGHPLRAGHPDNPTNKILWVVRTPRNGALTIDVPTAGCWQFDLRWANGHTQVEVMYIAS